MGWSCQRGVRKGKVWDKPNMCVNENICIYNVLILILYWLSLGWVNSPAEFMYCLQQPCLYIAIELLAFTRNLVLEQIFRGDGFLLFVFIRGPTISSDPHYWRVMDLHRSWSKLLLLGSNWLSTVSGSWWYVDGCWVPFRDLRQYVKTSRNLPWISI